MDISLKFVPKASIGSDNGLAQSRWQAIVWTSDHLVYWCINASLSLNELKQLVDLTPVAHVSEVRLIVTHKKSSNVILC